MESVSKLSTESVGSRRELVANCVHTSDADATKQFRCVLGITVPCLLGDGISQAYSRPSAEAILGPMHSTQ